MVGFLGTFTEINTIVFAVSNRSIEVIFGLRCIICTRKYIYIYIYYIIVYYIYIIYYIYYYYYYHYYNTHIYIYILYVKSTTLSSHVPVRH